MRAIAADFARFHKWYLLHEIVRELRTVGYSAIRTARHRSEIQGWGVES